MLYFVLYMILLTSVSLAAAAALFCDSFFFISLTSRRLKPGEINLFRLFSGISAIGSIIAIVSLISLMSIRISNGIIPGENMLTALIVMLIVTFSISLGMRNVHLPALHRHQHQYHHLSDSFIHHERSLLSSGVISIISWIFILTILAADSRGVIVSFGFWRIILSYAVFAYVFSKLFPYIKRKIS